VCQVEKTGGVGTVAHHFKGGGDVEQGGGTGLLHAARRWGRVRVDRQSAGGWQQPDCGAHG
jgi:hypothetical protein